jgi:outer membrane protein OmpA-like peptidoglycan-associated protein
MKIKKYLLLSLMLFVVVVAHAQEKGSYLLLNAGGGIHNIAYKLENGTGKSGLGLTGNIAYNYFFSPNFGIGTGLGIQSYKSRSVLNYISSNPSIDTDGDAYEYRISYQDWEESHNMLTIDIPLGLNYQNRFGEKSGLLASIGAKVSFPVKASYKTTNGAIVTTGYYEQWNVELRDMPQHNFNTLTSFPSAKFTAKQILSLYADLGYLHKLTDKMDLYLGAYLNYSSNSLVSSSTNLVYQQDGVYNGVMTSNQINSAKLVSFGVKIGINLRLSKNKVVPSGNEEITELDSVKQETEIVKSDTIKTEPTEVVEIIEKDTVKVVVIDTLKESYEEAKEINEQINFKFNYNSDEPINRQDDKYTELANLLKANPEMKIHIVGHTSDEGSKKVNIKIGLARANAVKKIMLEKGVPESQITTESKYYLEPLVPNTTEENKAINRRVEVIIK